MYFYQIAQFLQVNRLNPHHEIILSSADPLYFQASLSFLVYKAQKIYSCDSPYDADVKIYVVDSKYDADLLVYKEESKYNADGNDGHWYFVESRYDADKKVYFTDSKYDADLLSILWIVDTIRVGEIKKGFTSCIKFISLPFQEIYKISY